MISPKVPTRSRRADYGHPWIEFRIGNAVLNVFKLDGERTGGLAYARAVGVRR